VPAPPLTTAFLARERKATTRQIIKIAERKRTQRTLILPNLHWFRGYAPGSY
jgi:hypothetical protein